MLPNAGLSFCWIETSIAGKTLQTFRKSRRHEEDLRPPGDSFTLVELLVVIAIIAVLAGLLLPALAAAKASGLRAKCMSNQHQIAVTVGLYLGDFQKYPPYDDLTFRARRLAYWDSKLLVYAAGSMGVFLCPGNTGSNNSVSNNWFFRDRVSSAHPNKSYGYNAHGTAGWMAPARGSLGLDGDLAPASARGILLAPLSEAKVLVPSDMIAVTDYDPLASDDDADGDLHPDFLFEFAFTGKHHRGAANVAFCDGHVEYARTNRWIVTRKTSRFPQTDPTRARWNNDHQPHPETAF